MSILRGLLKDFSPCGIISIIQEIGGETMKYPIIILSALAISSLLIMYLGVFSPRYDSTDKVVTIAHQMREVAFSCRTLSSEQVQAKQQQFLNDNKTATIDDLVKAIEMHINGQNIIALLRSFKSDACDEYAASIESAYGRGNQAINKGFGTTSIETMMYWRLL